MAAPIASSTAAIQNPVEGGLGLLGTVMSEVSRGSGASRGSPSAVRDGGKIAYSVVSSRTGSGARFLLGSLAIAPPGHSTRPSSSRILKNQPITGTKRKSGMKRTMNVPTLLEIQANSWTSPG